MASNKKLDQLRKELIESLEHSEVDYTKVLDLSSALARLDPHHVRFSVDAGLIGRLGKELVAREETAVSELVKNAYDADATRVELSFEEADAPGGILTIEDDGHGMTREQLINGFMRLSSTDKIENPISPKYNRRRAGRKGIGRFATQRLGNRLTIITQTEKAKKALRVEIDWRRFKGNIELSSIESRIEEVEKQKISGTILTIQDLSDSWPNTSITRIYRYLADLIQPFPLSKQAKRPKFDPGFDINLYRISNGDLTVVASVEEMVYKYAIAEIEGVVDDKGNGAWSINSPQLDIDEKTIKIGADRDNAETPFKFLKDIHFKAYYYIYKSGLIPPTQEKLIRELADERGGIRVYRNGFRVLPYGEPLNDWLELDASSGRRWILPPHANLNFYGFVELNDHEGELFQETSSREGLIENDAFKELVRFVSRVLKDVAIKVGHARSRKTTPSQKNWIKEQTPLERLRDSTHQLNQIASDVENGITEDSDDFSRERAHLMTRAIRNIVEELEETAKQQEEETAARIAERGMLRVLAGLGLTIGEFTHEIRHRFPPIIGDASYFLDVHKKGKPRDTAERLISHLNTFRTYTSYFDRAVSENARREMKIQNLAEVARAFAQVIRPAAQRYAIEIREPKVYGYDLFTCPMHPSEWVSILFNLYTNSQKAIKKAGKKGDISIRVGKGKDKENVYVEFSDNGIGIVPEIKDKIFDAFFTTSSPANPLSGDQDEIVGTGLGLKIVRDIITGYGGQITLTDAPQGFVTCFRIEVPRASDEEVKRHGY